MALWEFYPPGVSKGTKNSLVDIVWISVTLSKENVVFSFESQGCRFWSLCLKCNEIYVQETLTIIISTKWKRFLLCYLCRWYSTSSKVTVAFRKPVHAPSLHHFRNFWPYCFCSSWSYGVLLYETLTVGESAKLSSLLFSYCFFYFFLFFMTRNGENWHKNETKANSMYLSLTISEW